MTETFRTVMGIVWLGFALLICWRDKPNNDTAFWGALIISVIWIASTK